MRQSEHSPGSNRHNNRQASGETVLQLKQRQPKNVMMRKLRELNPDSRKHFRKIVDKMVKTRHDFESLRESSKVSAESNKKVIRDLRLTDRSLQRSLHSHNSQTSLGEKSLESYRSNHIRDIQINNRGFDAPKRSVG